MNSYFYKSLHRFLLISCLSVLILSCNQDEPVAEPTPKPVEAATVELPPTLPPTATNTLEPTAEPTDTPNAADGAKATIDPANDGTLLTAPVMQGDPIVLEFTEADSELIASGVGPIAPASSISFTFFGYPQQTLKATTEGGTFGTALLLNGISLPVQSVQGRSNVWVLSEPGEYEFTLSNGGAGANYRYDFRLTKPENTDVVLPPQQIQFGQGVSEAIIKGEGASGEPLVYLFDGFEGQALSFAMESESSRFVVINTVTGEQFEPAEGESSLQIDSLPNNGEYRIEVSSDTAEPFELTVSLLP